MKLIRANIQDAENLWKMQITAFQDLYAKYQDPETSPVTETLEKTILRLEQPYTYFYYINVEDSIVGAMRVIDHKEDGKYKFLSPIFIMKEFRGRGGRSAYTDILCGFAWGKEILVNTILFLDLLIDHCLKFANTLLPCSLFVGKVSTTMRTASCRGFVSNK